MKHMELLERVKQLLEKQPINRSILISDSDLNLSLKGFNSYQIVEVTNARGAQLLKFLRT